MTVRVAVAVLCLAWLAAGAGRLPAVVAVLTLAAVAADALVSRGQAAEPGGPGGGFHALALPLLLAAAYVAGLLVALPAYAAWSARGRTPLHAAAAAGAALALLLALDTHVKLYRGLFWPE